ncbi:Holliday junction resolvase RecU [Lacticaseibacillus brantae]|uniref:Holliday junction resolvase RecU n=1 Tax=Lacticaseibacillus brantae DSM 23927 TaxID=1423727 RepID=A0A0R2AZF2_9LACO|nr:Holliday junction resolvase RecU [Lacticaseibacillus brantae]KRM72670.1 Holliday junction-specific endonuclease [Lacticaseibacillus brantae DSM 23927]
MALHYPNGQPFVRQPSASTTNYASRGMTLEEELNLSNQYYLEAGLAVVHKKPTPIQIVKVDYPKRSQAVIKEAYFRTPSTTDYNGVYQGYYLDFDAKETKNKTSFPLKNLHPHQVAHMQRCLDQGGICFLVIRFVTLHRVFVFPASNVIAWFQQQDQGGRKSIPLADIEAQGFELKPQLQPVIPYLTGVDWLIQTKVGGTRGN